MPPWTLASFTRAPCEGRHNATSKETGGTVTMLNLVVSDWTKV